LKGYETKDLASYLSQEIQTNMMLERHMFITGY